MPLTKTVDEPRGPIHARENQAPPSVGLIKITGGRFTMGSDKHYREESPAHQVAVDDFWMDQHPVTNEQFFRFVRETGYVTFAEREPTAADYPGAKPELLFAGSVVFRKPQTRVDISNCYNWWSYIRGANWRHPEGPRSTLKGKSKHPVVHVAYEDAVAYAKWANKDLPTEAEWEFAARGGLDGTEYAWGDELMPGGRIMANTWQGEFPYSNDAIDGYEGTSPVGAFPPNGYGILDMIGNAWEWTSDWYTSRHTMVSNCCSVMCNPRGGDPEHSYDPRTPDLRIPRKVTKGGSHLCAPNYCRRYRPAARMAQPIDTSTCHLGFRCVVRSVVPAQHAAASRHCHG